MSLERFIADVNNKGISRDNRFEVEGTAIAKGFETLVQTASLPSIQFHTNMWRNYGHGKRYINNAFFPEITISFYDTDNQDVSKYYNTWIAEIYQNGQFQYKDVYTLNRTLIVHKLNRKNDKVLSYHFDKVFPTNISEVPLNQASQNTASILTVTLSYDQWSAT